MTVTTPTIRRAGRRGLFWIAGGAFVIVVAIITMLFTGAAGRGGTPLSADNPGPAGSKAIAAVLRGQGVTVTATESLQATRAAADAPEDTTLFLFDAEGRLDDEQLRAAADLADRVVLMTPNFDALQVLAPSVAQAGSLEGSALKADCDLAAVTRAGTVSRGGSSYRLKEDAAGAPAVSAAATASCRWSSSPTVTGNSPSSAPPTRSPTSTWPSTATLRSPSACSVRPTPWSGTCRPWPTSPAARRASATDAAVGHAGHGAAVLRRHRRSVLAGTAPGSAHRRESAGRRALERDDGGQGPVVPAGLREAAGAGCAADRDIGRLAAACALPRTAGVDEVAAAVAEIPAPTACDPGALGGRSSGDRPGVDPALGRPAGAGTPGRGRGATVLRTIPRRMKT